MGERSAVIWWARRDLRLGDNPALTAASGAGGPVIPVFICDERVEAMGRAPQWRLGLSLESLGDDLAQAGSRLILRRGRALPTLRALMEETGARAAHWTHHADPDALSRDREVADGLRAAGFEVHVHSGHQLFEPWSVETQSGGFYKVFTPMWRAVRDRDVPEPLPKPDRMAPPEAWPASDDLEAWHLGAGMRRGAAVVARHVCVGERAAIGRLGAFMSGPVETYAERRDIPGVNGTSNLSENLTYGEIGPRRCWHAGRDARARGASGAEGFLQELVWRDFAYHLAYHTPRLTSGNWREEWDAFPWSEDTDRPQIRAWQRGRTGIRFVDAAMRELWVTGRMHNRARMIVASYLTKHLMGHWKIGKAWFEDTLIDWDPASNALGWQWAAGSGPDATPYFRIFNPVTQLDRFDKDRAYVSAWIAEGQDDPPPTALSYFEAIPRSWNMAPDDPYPDPVVPHKEGRARALEAYENRNF